MMIMENKYSPYMFVLEQECLHSSEGMRVNTPKMLYTSTGMSSVALWQKVKNHFIQNCTCNKLNSVHR